MWKLDENVAYYESQKWQNPSFLTKISPKSVFFDERKMTFFGSKILWSLVITYLSYVVWTLAGSRSLPVVWFTTFIDRAILLPSDYNIHQLIISDKKLPHLLIQLAYMGPDFSQIFQKSTKCDCLKTNLQFFKNSYNNLVNSRNIVNITKMHLLWTLKHHNLRHLVKISASM